MPSNSSIIRSRVLRLIDQHEDPITRRSLLRQFNGSARRAIANQQISDLIAEGRLALTGRGRRGDPEKLSKGINWQEIETKPKPVFALGMCPVCKRPGYIPAV